MSFQGGEGKEKLVSDVRVLLAEIGRRHEQAMDDFYPKNTQGDRPWGYLWAQTMPCDECKHYFPMVGSAILRVPNLNTGDPGTSFSFVADRGSGQFEVVIHEGTDSGKQTLFSMGNRGKVARCPFCDHPHIPEIIKAKSKTGLLRDKLLIVADLDPVVGVEYRLPTPEDHGAVHRAEEALTTEKPFLSGIPAVPNEPLPPNNYPIDAAMYGVRTFGGLCCDRQTLSFVRLCRVISDLQMELQAAGFSDNYTRALLGYAGAVVIRKLRYSTRGATLRPANKQVDHIFKNQANLTYGMDYFERCCWRTPITGFERVKLRVITHATALSGGLH